MNMLRGALCIRRNVILTLLGLGLMSCVALVSVSMVSADEKNETGQSEERHKYVGAKKCKMCHKSSKKGNQYGKWKELRHSKAYTTLAGDEAKKIAVELGIDEPQKSEKCLKCHVTGYGKDPELFENKFKIEDGVQCEACHGPGSHYAKLSIMKDREKAEAKRLITPDEKLCLKCHNEESPTYEEFCYAHFLAKVLHPSPNVKHEPRIIKCTCDKNEDLKLN